MNKEKIAESPLEVLMSATPRIPSISFGKPCTIQRIVNELPEQYSKALAEQLDTPSSLGGPTHFDIAKRLTLAGFALGPSTVGRHRNNTCSCLKEGN